MTLGGFNVDNNIQVNAVTLYKDGEPVKKLMSSNGF
tara:strand:+ start:120 stop:227 length:108 start_codon:yes stop_codon:yes gene_type:complete